MYIVYLLPMASAEHSLNVYLDKQNKVEVSTSGDFKVTFIDVVHNFITWFYYVPPVMLQKALVLADHHQKNGRHLKDQNDFRWHKILVIRDYFRRPTFNNGRPLAEMKIE